MRRISEWQLSHIINITDKEETEYPKSNKEKVKKDLTGKKKLRVYDRNVRKIVKIEKLGKVNGRDHWKHCKKICTKFTAFVVEVVMHKLVFSFRGQLRGKSIKYSMFKTLKKLNF